MIRAFFAAFLILAVSTWAAEKPPTLAIINGTSSPAAADLLLSKLSASGEFAFVERKKLAEVVKEQKLSSFSREPNVSAGKLLGADALLFVEADKEVLHVRLVETSRGERLFDEVFPVAGDLAPVAEAVRSRLAALAGGLRTPPRDRLYVALGPVASARSTAAFRESLATLGTLIGVRLSQQERVLVVERENLAAVSAEQPLTGKTAADLIPADAIVRARLADGDADKLSLEFQIQRPNGAALAVFSKVIPRHRLQEAAEEIAASISRSLGTRDQKVAASSTKAEAVRQHRNGAALLQGRMFEPALRYLETACLLEPANDDYAKAYLGGVANCLQRGGQLDRGPMAERTPARDVADYLYYIDRLRSAMAISTGRPAVQSAPVFNGEHVFQFLGRDLGGVAPGGRWYSGGPLKLDEDEQAQVVACREEFLAFLERFAEAGARAQVRVSEFSGWELLGRYCPYCFAAPRDALVYIRKLAEAGHFSWSILESGHSFTFTRHWAQAQAIPLWGAFLDEVQRKPAAEAQFGALMARCWMRDSFGLYLNVNYPERPAQRTERAQAAEQLMAWLAESADHIDLAADQKRWGTWEFLWRALDVLPLQDQDRYFERPMMRFFQRAHRLDSYYHAFTYLARRCASNVDKGAAPGDGPQIRAHIDRALGVLAASLPTLHQDALGRLRTEPSLSRLLMPDQLAGSGLPGGVLLFDSPGEERPVDLLAGRPLNNTPWNASSRGSFTGITEGDILWLARLRETALVVTRVVISKRTSETYVIPSPATGVTARLKISMALSPTHLVLADRYRVFAIPRANKAPFLDVAKCQVAGPKFGKDDTGGSAAAIAIAPSKGEHIRHITAAFPARDSVYLGLEERTVSGDCLYGALYRWRLGAGESELLCANDSLQPGPLNDCHPYRLLGGCATPAGGVCFVLDTLPTVSAEGRRRGLWKYAPDSAKWEQITDLAFAPVHDDPPRLRAPGCFDIANASTHWQLNLEKGTVQPAKGAVGGADPERGWYHYPESAAGVLSEAVVRLDGAKQSRRFAVPKRDGELAALLPTEQGLIVLLDGREVAGDKTTQRRMAYLFPEEK